VSSVLLTDRASGRTLVKVFQLLFLLNTCLSVAARHIRADLSVLPVASSFPSGENETEVTGPEEDLIGASSCFVPTSQTFTTPSELPITSLLLSGEKVNELMAYSSAAMVAGPCVAVKSQIRMVRSSLPVAR
jgi:hypothetical protein